MKSLQYLLVILPFFLTHCSSRIFYISAKPEGALLRHGEYYGYSNIAESGQEEIPYKVMFAGKKAKTSFSAMKRGYYEDTIWVNRDSPQKVSFVLNKIEGSEIYTEYRYQFSGAMLHLLPPQVDVILHKGIGNLDRYEKSHIQSKEVSKNILTLLSERSSGSPGEWRLIINDPVVPADTVKVPEHIMHYLHSIRPDLLKYYGFSPSVGRFNSWSHISSASNLSGSSYHEHSFLAVVYCKTIKPTAGRIIGNAAVSVASAAASGYQSAMYGTSGIVYDPNAFALDNSTLLMVYLVHPDSGEVVEITQKIFNYDISSIENQKQLTDELIKLLSDI